jgi:hypothetical protein
MTQRRFLLSDFVAKSENPKGTITQGVNGTNIWPWKGWANQDTTPTRENSDEYVWNERRDRLGKPRERC